jgi:hypothetical protein
MMVPNARISVVSCTPTGTTVMEIAGEPYYLDPGQNWSSQSVRDEGNGCYQTFTVAFSSEGFVISSGADVFLNFN